MMARIVVEAESNMAEFTSRARRQQRRLSIAEAICESIAHAAEDLRMARSLSHRDRKHRV